MRRTLTVGTRVYVRLADQSVTGRVTAIKPRGKVEVTTCAGAQVWPVAEVWRLASTADLVSLAALALALLLVLIVLYSDA